MERIGLILMNNVFFLLLLKFDVIQGFKYGEHGKKYGIHRLGKLSVNFRKRGILLKFSQFRNWFLFVTNMANHSDLVLDYT